MPRGGKRPGAGRKSLTDEEKAIEIKTMMANYLLKLIPIEKMMDILAKKIEEENLRAIETGRKIIIEGLSNNNTKNNININQVIIERKIIDTTVES